jgi:septum formation protein
VPASHSPALVLASGSPQRRAILTQLGIPFEVLVSGACERETGPPDEVAAENARRKAAAVAARRPQDLVLGVDTVVALDGRSYGKPGDEAAARATLGALSGRVHTVISGVCVHGLGQARAALVRTQVQFRTVDERLLDWYLASQEWRERAGAYAIQGRGAALVRGIEGDYFNVVGLPVATLLELAPEVLGPARGPVR